MFKIRENIYIVKHQTFFLEATAVDILWCLINIVQKVIQYIKIKIVLKTTLFYLKIAPNFMIAINIVPKKFSL